MIRKHKNEEVKMVYIEQDKKQIEIKMGGQGKNGPG